MIPHRVDFYEPEIESPPEKYIGDVHRYQEKPVIEDNYFSFNQNENEEIPLFIANEPEMIIHNQRKKKLGFNTFVTEHIEYHRRRNDVARSTHSSRNKRSSASKS